MKCSRRLWSRRHGRARHSRRLTPATLRRRKRRPKFRSHNAEAAWSVAYGMFLPQPFSIPPARLLLIAALAAAALAAVRRDQPRHHGRRCRDRRDGDENGCRPRPGDVAMAERMPITDAMTAADLARRAGRRSRRILMVRAMARLERGITCSSRKQAKGVTTPPKSKKAEAGSIFITITPGLGIASMMARLNRRRTAPARQQRGVQIEQTELGGIENGLRRSCHRRRPRRSGIVRANSGRRFRVSGSPASLRDAGAVPPLHRRRLQFHAAPGGLCRPCRPPRSHGHGHKLQQRRHREIRRAHEVSREAWRITPSTDESVSAARRAPAFSVRSLPLVGEGEGGG